MLHRANELTSLILKVMAIGLVVVLVLWFGVSIWGNYAIHHQNQPMTFDNPPSVATAPYQVNIRNTGEVYYAKSYTEPSTGVYLLNGYYAAPKGKWIFYKIPLPIDEHYWGPVTVAKR